MARYTAMAERRMPPIQEKYLKVLPGVQFAFAIDRNHYLAKHNLQYSNPQGPDPVWNAEHCRDRIFYRTRASILGERSPKPLQVAIMRRDYGSGRYEMMKVAGARIFINGRRWGRAALGYILQ